MLAIDVETVGGLHRGNVPLDGEFRTLLGIRTSGWKDGGSGQRDPERK